MSVTIRRLNRRAVVLFAGAVTFLFAVASPGVAVPGDLDPAFGGGDGKVTTDFGDQDHADGVAIQADGKIVVAGSSGGAGGRDFAVARYNADGSLDPTFDADGKVTTDFASSHDQGFAVALQGDGKIVVRGSPSSLRTANSRWPGTTATVPSMPRSAEVTEKRRQTSTRWRTTPPSRWPPRRTARSWPQAM